MSKDGETNNPDVSKIICDMKSRFSRNVLSYAIDDVVRVVKFSSDTGESHICWDDSPDV